MHKPDHTLKIAQFQNYGRTQPHYSGRKYASIWIAIFILISIAGGGIIQPAQAQSALPDWSQPVNLSLSLAASQPRIVGSPAGVLQVFWIDRFDGLVTSVFSGNSWSNPEFAPLITDSLTSQASKLTMPYLIGDANGQVHAFWQESKNDPANPSFSLYTLYHSTMPIGSTTWSAPQQVAEDAVIFNVTAPPSGGVTLGYIRRVNNAVAPYGVFVRKLSSTSNTWSSATLVHRSIYYRLLNPGDITLSVADDGVRNVLVAWEDPYLRTSLSAFSKDGGNEWSLPTPVGDSELNPQDPRVTAIPGAALAIWETTSLGRCALYQQQLSTSSLILPSTPTPASPEQPGSTLPTPTLQDDLSSIGTPLPPTLTPSPVQPAPGWGTPQPIFPNLQSCPTGDQFWPKPKINQIFWLWGVGSSNLSLTTFNVAKNEWSLPINFSISFQNPANQEQVSLGDLHATLDSPAIAVTGIDANGDVWVTISQSPTIEFAFAPPPPWTNAQRVSDPAEPASDPALAVDEKGRVHLVWVQPVGIGELGASINYGTWDSTTPTSDQMLLSTTTLYPSNPNELARQPALLSDPQASLLHMVWSGGEDGDILYSRVGAEQADSPGDWLPAQALSVTSFAAWPQVGIDAQGHLSVVYIVPFNEDRGVYLARSENRGESWSLAEKIFGNTVTGAQSIDHPALAVSPEGDLHLAWVEKSPAGSSMPMGIFYSASRDGGKTWSDPAVAAGPGYDWPRLVMANGKLHLFYGQIVDRERQGELWHRQLEDPSGLDPAAGSENNWMPAERIPGWQNVSLPYGVAVEGLAPSETLHLVGVNPVSGNISYSTWIDNTWSQPENYTPTDAQAPGNGLQAATRPQGGHLAVAWLVQDEPLTDHPNALYFAARKISTSDVPLLPTLAPTPTPYQVVTPTETVVVLTPTPNLNQVPAPTDTGMSPLIFSGVLAVLAVVGLIVWRSTSERRRK